MKQERPFVEMYMILSWTHLFTNQVYRAHLLSRCTYDHHKERKDFTNENMISFQVGNHNHKGTYLHLNVFLAVEK